jgi:hypothetical protein
MQLLPEFGQFLLSLFGLGKPPGSFSRVLGAPVNPFEQRRQFLLKRGIVVWAP